MFFIEGKDYWISMAKRMVGNRLPIQKVELESIDVNCLMASGLFAVEYERVSLDSWLSLFDKIDLRLENLRVALLGAPHDAQIVTWCREIGFSDFVRDFASLECLLNNWGESANHTVPSQDLLAASLQLLPWD